MNVYSFNYSTVTFLSIPEPRNYLRKCHQQICFFIGLRTLKPTRTRTLNRKPIWHGLIVNKYPYIILYQRRQGRIHLTWHWPNVDTCILIITNLRLRLCWLFVEKCIWYLLVSYIEILNFVWLDSSNCNTRKHLCNVKPFYNKYIAYCQGSLQGNLI